ncbi:hypothetical protein D3C81_1052810 [compost metagenome]
MQFTFSGQCIGRDWIFLDTNIHAAGKRLVHCRLLHRGNVFQLAGDMIRADSKERGTDLKAGNA